MSVWLVVWFSLNGTHAMMQMPVDSRINCEQVASTLQLTKDAFHACATEQQAANSIYMDGCTRVAQERGQIDLFVCTTNPREN